MEVAYSNISTGIYSHYWNVAGLVLIKDFEPENAVPVPASSGLLSLALAGFGFRRKTKS